MYPVTTERPKNTLLPSDADDISPIDDTSPVVNGTTSDNHVGTIYPTQSPTTWNTCHSKLQSQALANTSSDGSLSIPSRSSNDNSFMADEDDSDDDVDAFVATNDDDDDVDGGSPIETGNASFRTNRRTTNSDDDDSSSRKHAKLLQSAFRST